MHLDSPSTSRLILSIVGTRPEAIKMAPVILRLQREPGLKHLTVATGQHGDMLDSMLDFFGIVPDVHLRLMRDGQSVSDVAARCLTALSPVIAEHNPAMVLVQGDTATACFGALAAFLAQVPTGHVEAGLRTSTKHLPFPEELFRRVVGVVADLHFAPTERCRRNLLAAGIPESSIVVTGNPVVDAIDLVRQTRDFRLPSGLHLRRDRRLVLLTMHRRESFGAPMRASLLAARDLVRAFPDIELVVPVHPNPSVRAAVSDTLAGQERVRLLAPVPYPQLLALLQAATLVLTDSGGIQEEAPSFGVPVLVLRNETERKEGLENGLAFCVGPIRDRIIEEASAILRGEGVRYDAGTNPYGDGMASERIVRVLRERILEHTVDRDPAPRV